MLMGESITKIQLKSTNLIVSMLILKKSFTKLENLI